MTGSKINDYPPPPPGPSGYQAALFTVRHTSNGYVLLDQIWKLWTNSFLVGRLSVRKAIFMAVKDNTKPSAT